MHRWRVSKPEAMLVAYVGPGWRIFGYHGRAHVGSILAPTWPSWLQLGAMLALSWPHLRHLGSNLALLALSWAMLGSIWAYMGSS